MPAKPQLHSTYLSMLTNCGEQYRRRVIEGEIIPPGVAIHIGRATHKGVERNLKAKARTGDLLELDDIQTTVADDFRHGWELESVRLLPDEVDRGMNVIRDEALDMAVRLATLHAEELAPGIEPISERHVERQFAVELKDWPFDLAGTIDVQEKTRIRDTKTSKKSIPQSDVDSSEQLTIYAIGAHINDNMPYPIEVVIDGLIKLKKPKEMTVTSNRDQIHVCRFLDRLVPIIRTLEAGIFLPANPAWWGCSKKWCGYASTCKYWSGRE